MRWKHNILEVGMVINLLIWFFFFVKPDRICLKKIMEYAIPLTGYTENHVKFGDAGAMLSGDFMDMVVEHMPIYGYSMTYFGQGAEEKDYQELRRIMLAESEENNENIPIEMKPEEMETEEPKSNNMEEEGEPIAYKPDRINEEESVFYITDGEENRGEDVYPQFLLKTNVMVEKPWEDCKTQRDLIDRFYTLDETTYLEEKELVGETLMHYDFSLQRSGDEPEILIYHTHSQEGYADSISGDANTSIVAAGELLTQILEKEYGYKVLHYTEKFDVDNRDYAYSNALPAIEQVLAQHSGIKVIIDLHRDAVNCDTYLVHEVQGVRMAQIMFFNGLCRVKDVGDISYLPNENLKSNLAFSFQMQMACEKFYPGLTRKIYLKGYRYNMHLRPCSLLVELGAQNNTLQEAKNACVPLARALHYVLSHS